MSIGKLILRLATSTLASMTAVASANAGNGTADSAPTPPPMRSGIPLFTDVWAYEHYDQPVPPRKYLRFLSIPLKRGIPCDQPHGCMLILDTVVGLECANGAPFYFIYPQVDGQEPLNLAVQATPGRAGTQFTGGSIRHSFIVPRGRHSLDVRVYNVVYGGVEPQCKLEDWHVDLTVYASIPQP